MKPLAMLICVTLLTGCSASAEQQAQRMPGPGAGLMRTGLQAFIGMDAGTLGGAIASLDGLTLSVRTADALAAVRDQATRLRSLRAVNVPDAKGQPLLSDDEREVFAERICAADKTFDPCSGSADLLEQWRRTLEGKAGHGRRRARGIAELARSDWIEVPTAIMFGPANTLVKFSAPHLPVVESTFHPSGGPPSPEFLRGTRHAP